MLLHVHSTLRTDLSSATKPKGIAINPMLSVETPKQQKFYASPLTLVEWRKLMQAAQAEPTLWHLMWRITLATVLRQGEVLGLGWEDFNSPLLMSFHHKGFWQPMDTLREKEDLSKLARLLTPPWLYGV